MAIVLPRDRKIIFKVDGSDAPILISSGRFSLNESFSVLLPTAEILFDDNLGIFASEYPLLQDTKVEVFMQEGSDVRQVVLYPFSYKGKAKGRSTSYRTLIHLVSKFADPVFLKSEYYSDECKASDYVKEYAKRMGLKSDVEETVDSRVWINPGWKMGRMLRHLAYHSISVSGSSGYVYYINSDGVLVFRSVDSFFNEEVSGKIDVSDRSNVVSFSINRELLSATISGYNDVKLRQYNMTSAEDELVEYKGEGYVEKYAKTANFGGMWGAEGVDKYIGEYYEDQVDKYPDERNKEIFFKTMSRVESVVLNLIVKKDIFVRKIGDVVDVLIPSLSHTDKNLAFSGRYLVWSSVVIGSDDYFQKIKLVRLGLNIDDR